MNFKKEYKDRPECWSRLQQVRAWPGAPGDDRNRSERDGALLVSGLAVEVILA